MSNAIIFCNGMNNTIQSAIETQRALQAQVNATCKYSAHVDLVYNGACDEASTACFTLAGIIAAIGVAILGKNFFYDKKTNNVQLIIGSLLTSLGLAWIVKEYFDVLERKKSVANTLANQIKRVADDPNANITLCLHSQGADVGDQAIAQLGHLSKRVHVVTIGAARFTNLRRCKSVTHIENTRDWIPSLIAQARSSRSINLQRRCFANYPAATCQEAYGISRTSRYTAFTDSSFRHKATGYFDRDETMEAVCGLLVPTENTSRSA